MPLCIVVFLSFCLVAILGLLALLGVFGVFGVVALLALWGVVALLLSHLSYFLSLLSSLYSPKITKPRQLVLSRLLLSGGCLLSHLRSTIGVTGLNFSVRNGKRWIPGAITTLISRQSSLYTVTFNIIERFSLTRFIDASRLIQFFSLRKSSGD